MNAKQRRKSKRARIRAPFSLEFTSAKQSRVTQFMDNWMNAVGPELVDGDHLTPIGVDNLSSSESAIVQMNISFDFDLYGQSTTKEELA